MAQIPSHPPGIEARTSLSRLRARKYRLAAASGILRCRFTFPRYLPCHINFSTKNEPTPIISERIACYGSPSQSNPSIRSWARTFARSQRKGPPREVPTANDLAVRAPGQDPDGPLFHRQGDRETPALQVADLTIAPIPRAIRRPSGPRVRIGEGPEVGPVCIAEGAPRPTISTLRPAATVPDLESNDSPSISRWRLSGKKAMLAMK